MGQKVNPIGIRLGINKTWNSVWFDEKDYAEKLHEDIITKSDGLTTIDFGKYYAILPSSGFFRIRTLHVIYRTCPNSCCAVNGYWAR